MPFGKDQTVDSAETDSDLTALRQLKISAPENLLLRLKRRVKIAQLGKDLFERQAFSFWIVLDVFLRLFLTHRPPAKKPSNNHQSTASINEPPSEII